MTHPTLGEFIRQDRQTKDLTQDEYGMKFDVSGPAIFKFERGFVRPSLKLWMEIAKGLDIPERRAALLWLKESLPKAYQQYLQINHDAPKPSSSRGKTAGRGADRSGACDYSRFDRTGEMRAAIAEDPDLPAPLREMLDDDILWSAFKPTGHEVNFLRDLIAPLGRGSVPAYRDALLLIREFTHSF
jgi:transcriptional regulator with XRE-family HTH domain